MNFVSNLKWHQIIISLLIGFCIGIMVGQAMGRDEFHNRWKNGSMRQFMVDKMSKELKLDAGQKEKVAAIFEAKHPRMVQIQQDMKPKFEAVRMETQGEIKELLRPDQQKLFEEMNAKWEEKEKQREKFFSS